MMSNIWSLPFVRQGAVYTLQVYCLVAFLTASLPPDANPSMYTWYTGSRDLLAGNTINMIMLK